MYRFAGGGALEVLLAHPGGPFFAKKDAGAWTIPKGEPEPAEDDQACALREFQEETGIVPAAQRYLDLGTIVQRGGKHVHAFAFEGDWDQTQPVPSNTFEIEWPPRSGRRQSFPEIDGLAFFDLTAARQKLNAAQHGFLDRLVEQLGLTR